MNQIRWIALAAGLIVATLITVGFSLPSKSITQPLPFNHNLHIEEVGLECTDCHVRVKEHPQATLPGIEICQDCHLDPVTDSEVEQELLSYTIEGRAIGWERIYQVPDHVYFSHRRHVSLGELECETCHGNVSQLTAPPAQPLIDQSMNWCIACHEENNVSNDCLECHR